MSKNSKIIFNRAKKGKILSEEEEDILFGGTIGDMSFGIKYVNDILESRSSKFEEKFLKYCLTWNSMWGINEGEIIFYIKKRIKGPWPEIEKYFSDPFLQRYKMILLELGFYEHVI